MIHVDIIAVGRMKNGPLLELWKAYAARMRWKLTLHELDGGKSMDEEKAIRSKRDPSAFLFIMDERGKSLPSTAFAKKIEEQTNIGQSRFQFIIGGADGLSDSLRKEANFLLSFGAQTWPHMLARIMLIEQLYRAQQIVAGHPYHRE